MNIRKAIRDGLAGRNIGLTTGLSKLDTAIHGFQKKTSIALGAEPKVGKTSFADFSFLLMPYLVDVIGKKKKVDWIYYSFEIDRVEKEAKFISFFLKYEYNESISHNHILGREKSKMSLGLQKKVDSIIEKYIHPLFGEYDRNGVLLHPGLITFIEQKSNPTGIRNFLWNRAEQYGEFIREPYDTIENGRPVTKSRIIGYKENDPELHTIIITDHVRALKRERGFSMKENIDKFSEYSVNLRNRCKFSFVHICHLNRNLNDIQRLKFMGSSLYPDNSDFKDSGNLAEDATITLTLFNPLDDKYKINEHFGKNITPYKGQYRSLHIVFSRNTVCPLHIQLLFDGATNRFKQL